MELNWWTGEAFRYINVQNGSFRPTLVNGIIQ